MSIVEVAKLAGCSHMTVSRVINQQPGVSAKAATRVREAIKQLNYVPPLKRRGPQRKTRRRAGVGNIAVMLFGAESAALAAPVAAVAIRAIGDSLAAKGFSMSLAEIRSPSHVPSIVAQGNVDGLLLQGIPPSKELAGRLKRFPAVWFLSPRAKSGYWGDRVSPDNGLIGQRAAEYFINRGHRRIGFLGLDATHLVFPERLTHFQQAAAEAQVACDVIRAETDPVHRYGDYRTQRDYIDRLISDYAKLEDRPTGLFVPRGQAILMVFDSLRYHGIEPGRDVTIIACDNDPALAGLNPQVATIDVRPDLVGRQAVEQLLLRIEKPDLFTSSKIFVEPTVIEPAGVDARPR